MKTDEVTYSSILEEHDVVRAQRETRRNLLADLADASLNDKHKPNGVIAHISRGSLLSADVPILGSVLRKIGDVHTLNLIIQSPGGEGTVVEKFVALCRAQCQRFRVIIPNEAKSAATLIALGADEIIMGACSELGPIDAQIPVFVNGAWQILSAQDYIDARDKLLVQHAEKLAKGEDVSAILQMIASLDLPFINECERMMDFGRDVARKLLTKFMFRKTKKDPSETINKIVDTLSSVERFKVHGRLIDGNTAKRELGLNVKLCGLNDHMWKKIWEYYTRAEIALSGGRGMKLFETEHELLVAPQGGE